MTTVALTTAANVAAQTAVQVGTAALTSFASASIRRAFDTREFEGPRLDRFRVMGSVDGAPLPRVWGRARLGGQVIWASRLRETRTTEKVGKGGPTRTDYSYSISFAVALCEGTIAGVDRIWVNGELLETVGLTFRVHMGAPDQLPDPLIQAIDGVGNEGGVPAFRGTAYLVFEDFPVDAYGGRLPQINAEVVRPVDEPFDGDALETLITGVNLLPSSGEFAYQPTPVEALGAVGEARPLNINNPTGQADVEVALDQLADQLPACRSVSIISSWFGTDLRAGHCQIVPGVEIDKRLIDGPDWSVGAITRADAYLVSQAPGGGPVYGGTPSDQSLIALIRRLRERGYEVNLYPFILMDIPEGNGLPDPYGEAEQAAFPWRGRIRGEAVDMPAFFGRARASDFGRDGDTVRYGGEDAFGFRRFILHHAQIARIAGGVSRFAIGSEMVGLTTSAPDNGYPAVAELRALASEVRALLPDARLTYCADWTEYRGHQREAALTYHLDPLWADPNIDMVGIDAYFPLSDFRQGEEHLDAPLASSAHDLDYLAARVEGGELYDWFYASDADRAAQVRTPITDPAYRFKDVRSWWESTHRDLDASGTPGAPSAWQPRMKPIWFSEVGCPAVDLGANQPNVFVDPKSSESFLPYFSSGLRDDLIQRNYLRAFLGHYRDDPMVEAAHVWCWDARPYPDFPARGNVWADGPNWQLGHWLTGRLGRVALADLIDAVCREVGLVPDVTQVVGMVEGFVIDRAMSARAALENLCAAFGVDVFEAPDRLVFRSDVYHPSVALGRADLLDAPVRLTHADPSRLREDVRLAFIDSGRDHLAGLASGARRIGSHDSVQVSLPAVIDSGLAQTLATRMLDTVTSRDVEARFELSPRARVRVGDVVELPGEARRFLVTELDAPAGGGVAASAVSVGDRRALPLGGRAPEAGAPVPWTPAPVLFAFDLPTGLAVGAKLSPFATVAVDTDQTRLELAAPVHIGALATGLVAGPSALADRGNGFEVSGLGVPLDSVSESDWLAGANRFAVEHPGGWEILAARELILVGPGQYACRELLRGLEGSDAVISELPAGARVVWLGQGVESLADEGEPGEALAIRSEAAGRAGKPLIHTPTRVDLAPLAPAHPCARERDGRIEVTFVPRTRALTSWSGFDAPEGRRFEVVLLRSGETVARVETSEPRAVFEAVQADGVRVREASQRYGWGPYAEAGFG